MSDEIITNQISDRITVQGSGTKEFADGVYFIKECITSPPLDDYGEDDLLREWYDLGRERHTSQSAYVFKGDRTLLYDTLTPVGRDIILNGLDDLVDKLDYLVVSHPEANHAGNAPAILEQYPDATLVVPGRGSQHDLHGLGDLKDVDVRMVRDGDELDLGGHQIEFVEEVFFDHAMTIWLFERTKKILCTADFMGFEHMDGQCMAFADEFETGGPTDSQLERFNGHALTWLRFVEPEATDAALDRVIERCQPSYIAPAHGQVIREEAAEHLELMKERIRSITDREMEKPGVHTHQMIRYSR